VSSLLLLCCSASDPEQHASRQDAPPEALAATPLEAAAREGDAWAALWLGQAHFVGSWWQQRQAKPPSWVRAGDAEEWTRSIELLKSYDPNFADRAIGRDAPSYYMPSGGEERFKEYLQLVMNGEFTGTTAEAARWFKIASEAGLDDATCILATMHIYKKFDGAQPETGVAMLGPLVEQGHVRATLVLGFAHDIGAGVPEDACEAHKLYQRAAAAGSGYATYCLAFNYWHGRCVSGDEERARALFRAAADQGIGPAIRQVAYDKWQNDRPAPFAPDQKSHLKKALGWFHAGALRLDSDSLHQAAYLVGGPDDLDAKWTYRQYTLLGAVTGDTQSMRMFGERDHDLDLSIFWLRSAARFGDASAQAELSQRGVSW